MNNYTLFISDGQNDYVTQCKAITDKGIIKSAVRQWPYANPLRLSIKAYIDGDNMLPIEFTYYG